MLSTFLILVFGCIFNTNVCESRIDVSKGCLWNPSKCTIGTFCYVPPEDCGFYPPSCYGICQPGCQKPEHCQSEEKCVIPPNMGIGKCMPNPDLTIEMCIMKEANVSGSSGRSTPMGVNIKLVKCDMDEVCEQKPGQSTWFPYFGECVPKPALGDVVDVAIKAGNFKILVKLLSELQLVDALRNAKAQTIFAPSDEAFAKLQEDWRFGNFQNKTYEQKMAIVLRHVVPGATLLGADLTRGRIKTAGGEYIHLYPSSLQWGKFCVQYKISYCIIVDPADVKASNGVIHVTDQVITYPFE